MFCKSINTCTIRFYEKYRKFCPSTKETVFLVLTECEKESKNILIFKMIKFISNKNSLRQKKETVENNVVKTKINILYTV